MDLPPLAKENLPILYKTVEKYWKELKTPYYIGSQIEQETCINLKSKSCWSPKAELKTYNKNGCLIENGFGFGQITIVRDKTCKIKFDNFKYIKSLHKDLSNWDITDKYNKYNQMSGLVLYDKVLYTQWNNKTLDNKNQLAFMFSSYNGGYFGLQQDVQLCKTIKTCNPKIWFDNVEKYSYKQKSNSVYKKSFFQINREYVNNIMNIRFKKYQEYENKRNTS